MGGVYGDQLAFFAEQFRSVSYFSMSTDVVAGYSNRTDLGRVRGVFQYMKRGELMREHDTLSDVAVPTFWTRQKLKAGNFITIDSADDIFRLTNDQPWNHEGNFYIYILETVSGNTDRQEPHEYVDLGTFGGYQ